MKFGRAAAIRWMMGVSVASDRSLEELVKMPARATGSTRFMTKRDLKGKAALSSLPR